MANAIEEYLAETLKGIGGKLVNGKLEFDDPAKNEAWKETLSRAGGTIDAPRPSTADDSLANAAKADNQLLQQDVARAGLQVQTAKDLLPVRAARQAGDSNTYARNLTTNIDQVMRVLGERGRQISGLDEGMTGPLCPRARETRSPEVWTCLRHDWPPPAGCSHLCALR
jgi:hypothetical protein